MLIAITFFGGFIAGFAVIPVAALCCLPKVTRLLDETGGD